MWRHRSRLGARIKWQAVIVTEIRRAVGADWAQSRAIRLQALRQAPLAFASTYEREIAFVEGIWRQRINDAAQFLAIDDGAVVGTATGFVDPDTPRTVILVAMFVSPSARGRGVGERLVRAVVEHARTDGADEVRLHVVETNQAAERLYARCGFVRTGATMPLPHHPELTEHELVLPLLRTP